MQISPHPHCRTKQFAATFNQADRIKIRISGSTTEREPTGTQERAQLIQFLFGGPFMTAVKRRMLRALNEISRAYVSRQHALFD